MAAVDIKLLKITADFNRVYVCDLSFKELINALCVSGVWLKGEAFEVVSFQFESLNLKLTL